MTRDFDVARRPFLRWIVPAAVILLAVASSGDSVGSGPETATGVQVTKRVPFARESIDEIRALAPFRSQPAPRDRTIPFLRIPRQAGTTGETGSPPAEPALAAPSFASSPVPLAPALDGSFAGLGNPPHAQGDVIPPDTMGAAGPNHLVSLLNSDFGVFNKTTGALIPNQRFLSNRSGYPSGRRRENRRISRSTRKSSTISTAGGSSRSRLGEGAPRIPGS